MRRLIIIVLVLIAGWFIFQKDENSADEQKETEEITTEEEAITEEGIEEEAKKTPQAVAPTPPELVEMVEEAEFSSPQRRSRQPRTETMKEEETQEAKVTSKELERAEPIDHVVRVYLYEWGLDVSSRLVEGPNVAFEVLNNGRFSHAFAIRGYKNFGKILPGQIKVFRAKLEEGDTEVYSPRELDESFGMSEILYVGR